ncbi:MAG TPA: hypothetical protein VFJ58_13090 [Armatimonadota bacterium]|nr:hypothetical protein [Armatimonadota bacterium]
MGLRELKPPSPTALKVDVTDVRFDSEWANGKNGVRVQAVRGPQTPSLDVRWGESLASAVVNADDVYNLGLFVDSEDDAVGMMVD